MSLQTLSTHEVKQIWHQACSQLQLELSNAVFNTWILTNPLTEVSVDPTDQAKAIITCPTAFHSTNLKKNLGVHLQKVLSHIIGKPTSIDFEVGDPTIRLQKQSSSNTPDVIPPSASSLENHPTLPASDSHQKSPSNSESSFSNPSMIFQASPVSKVDSAASHTSSHANSHSFSTSTPHQVGSPRVNSSSPRVEDLFSESSLHSAQLSSIQQRARDIGLRQDYTFESFAVSTSNEMAHAAATAVSHSPGTAYSPLFLYGGVGVGKTHLMHALAYNILETKPNSHIIYCTGEEFTNQIVSAIQTKKAIGFKDRFRTVDVLLIDDVQFIAGKNTVQEEFFHTFNALIKNQKQIVLTSDRPPHEISLLESRLRSRFEAGLMIDIQQPSFELRTAILLIKSKAMGLPIPIDLAKLIASRVESARKIEGVLNSVKSAVQLRKQTLTPELVEKLLKVEADTKRPSLNVSITDVIKTVANHYHLKQSSLKGQSRVKALTHARHIAMFLCKEDLKMPYTEIGKWFSNRDHTSVLHAVNKIQDSLNENDLIQQEVSAIRMSLAGIRS